MPDISDVFAYIDKFYRQTRVATLDAMEQLRAHDDRGWALRPDESWRWLDKQSFDWNEQGLNLVPWTVMTWRLPAPHELELSFVHRYMSRVYRFQPMVLVALADLTPTPANSAGFWLEDQIRRGTTRLEPLLAGDDRVMEITATDTRTRPRHVAFAVSLARLVDPAALEEALVKPTARLVRRDHEGLLASLSLEDPARVALTR